MGDLPRRSLVRRFAGLCAALAILGLIAAVALPFAWPLGRQYWAVKGIERLGGRVIARPAGPKWLRTRIGNDWMRAFDLVESVQVEFTESIERFEPYLKAFPTPPRFVVLNSPVDSEL